jgi:IS30 family transposase
VASKHQIQECSAAAEARIELGQCELVTVIGAWRGCGVVVTFVERAFSYLKVGWLRGPRTAETAACRVALCAPRGPLLTIAADNRIEFHRCREEEEGGRRRLLLRDPAARLARHLRDHEPSPPSVPAHGREHRRPHPSSFTTLPAT